MLQIQFIHSSSYAHGWELDCMDRQDQNEDFFSDRFMNFMGSDLELEYFIFRGVEMVCFC